MKIIKVEDVNIASEILAEVDSKHLLSSIIDSTVLGNSINSGKFIDGKNHCYLQSIYYCYSSHRPFVVSPEGIWLLILQAFSAHMNSKSEVKKMNTSDLNNKKKLFCRKDNVDWNNVEDVEGVLSDFGRQVDDNFGFDFFEKTTNKFSDTDVNEKVAFQITSLSTFKSFFEFIVVSVICGIPSIHLKGEKDDWLKILKGLDNLKGFNFEWFIVDVSIIINRILKEYDAGEKISDDFWINIFKIHTLEEYGQPEIVDGWITSFFPFSKSGDRLSKDYFSKTPFKFVVKNVKSQIVDLDFSWVLTGGESKKVVPLVLKAGFIGINQDHHSFSLEPNIGWLVCDRSNTNLKELIPNHEYDILLFERLVGFPKELLGVEKIRDLVLNFEDEIDIPDEIGSIDIGFLKITGVIGYNGKQRIKKIFEHKNTLVYVNDKEIKTVYEELKLLLKKISPFHEKYIHY